MVNMERGGGFDKDAFDSLLKQLLETKEPSAEPSEEEPAPASQPPRTGGAPPAIAEPPPSLVLECEGVVAPPSTLPTAPAPARGGWPAERAAPTEQGAVHPEMEALKQRLADLEAMQSRLQEQLRQSAPPPPETPPAAPAAASEAEAMDRPVAVELSLVKVPDAGELSRPGARGLLERILDLLHRLFPGFVPAREAALPPDNPDALYAGRIEMVISAEDAWGRLERILTGLAGLRGARVHGLYSGPRGEQTVSLEMDMPASLKDVQEAVPEIKEIRTLSSQKGVTRLAVKIT